MKKIFVIEDDQPLISYLKKQLSNAGHEVITAVTGLSAIKMMAEHTPDVIFVDYFLPNLNGDKICQIIRKMAHLKNAYVVIMSGAASELHLNPAAVGADALIAKGSFQETVRH
ncbi:MAG: response regulator, partial [Pseudomonadota bacterium]